jgi:uncharacterized protein YgbK (DUF1537 family)
LRGGRLFVDGKAVVPDDLVETLRAQLPDVPVRRLPAGEAVEFTGQPWRLLVADAEDDAHLDYLVDVALARPEDVLLVGSSGLAASLARRAHLVDSATPAQSAARCQRVLFVVGSRNPKSVAQARALLCVDGVADFGVSLNEGPGQSFRFLGEPDARVGIVHVKGLENAPSSDPSLTARRLAEVAASLVVGDAISEVGIVMTGGDTARAALERLGVQVLSISRSLAPGVVLARAATLSGQSLSIVTKAGGFGQDDSFISIASYLLEGT